MSRVIFALLLALCGTTVMAALKVGDTQRDVIAELGRPASVKNTPKGAIWKFKDGTTIVLEANLVTEIALPGAGKPAAEIADVPEVPAPVTPPPPPPAASRTTPTSTPAKASAPTKAATPPRQATTAPTTTKGATPTTSAGAAPPVQTIPRVTPVVIDTGKKSAPAAPSRPPLSPVRRYGGLFFLGLGLLVLAVSQIMFLAQAFKAGVGWGLGCLFVPLVTLIFVITHWADTKKILALQLLGGLPVLFLGAMLLTA